MKLLSWLLLVHLVASTIASVVAAMADCDGDKLRALCLSCEITGWLTALSATAFLVHTAIKGIARSRDVIIAIILLLIGLEESRMAAYGWSLISA